MTGELTSSLCNLIHLLVLTLSFTKSVLFFGGIMEYEVVVATSAMICKKGFAPHTGARAIPPTLLDT